MKLQQRMMAQLTYVMVNFSLYICLEQCATTEDITGLTAELTRNYY